MLGAAPREELLERFGHLLGGQPFLPPAAPRAVQPRAQQRTVQRAPAVMVRAEGGGDIVAERGTPEKQILEA